MRVTEVTQEMYNLVITVETFLSSLHGGTLVPTRPHLLTGVKCLGEEASSQGMVVHSCKQLIEEARVIWKEKLPSCRFLCSSQFIQNVQAKMMVTYWFSHCIWWRRVLSAAAFHEIPHGLSAPGPRELSADRGPSTHTPINACTSVLRYRLLHLVHVMFWMLSFAYETFSVTSVALWTASSRITLTASERNCSPTERSSSTSSTWWRPFVTLLILCSKVLNKIRLVCRM